MPEGDTLYRVATTLDRALTGHTLVRGRLVERARHDGLGPTGLADVASGHAIERRVDGARVEHVEARGKNLLIHLSDARTIHTHLGMEGAWHLYRRGESWRKSARGARVHLETDEREAVCFHAPLIRLVETLRLDDSPLLREMGPDLLAEEIDLVAAAARFRRRNDAPIGVAIMDQRLVAGVGNVYKSETLFVEGVNPFAKVETLDDATLLRIVTRARELMRANVTGFPRRTRPARQVGEVRLRDGLFVYDRSGRPCHVCGTPIAMRRQGTLGRSTYYCPRCQGVESG